jgi:uncharacterized membrane protein (UPF0127 family)
MPDHRNPTTIMSRGRIIAAGLAVLAVVVVAAVALAGDDDAADRRTEAIVIVGGASVRAEIADDQASLQRGLSGRDSLAAEAGMLFLLPDDSPVVWMKGMRFPIDVVWIKDGRVVDVTADLPPPDGSGVLPTYSPDRPANRALEVNAGWAARHDVGRGDAVRARTPGGASF